MENKLTETASFRLTPEEKDQIKILSKIEQRKVSDVLHRLIFAGEGSQRLQKISCKREKIS